MDAQPGIEVVIAALARLAALGEDVADEVIYVRDLETVWTARLRAVAAARFAGGAPGPETATAFAALAAEADRITDPHRAIDWLSTLPQVALAALGEPA